MSMYCSIQTQFKHLPALIASLQETKNWTKEQIEIHAEPQTLYGHHGDARKEDAHIIIRRKNIGSASNDIGFLRNPDGTYQAIISEYDKRQGYGDKFIAQLKQNYAYHTIKSQQELRGRSVHREKFKNGKQRITISNLR